VERKPFRVSPGVQEGKLLQQIKPAYPKIAIISHVEGTVILHAMISPAGTIESLEVVSGHAMLTQAALDAVRQWRYRPTYLGGEPVEVETTITVNFVLNR
jgi:protein TonB